MQTIQSLKQISAGGVAYRENNDKVEIVLISVGEGNRWQLPKGMVMQGESFETAAQREVREEGGVETEILTQIDTIDFWFFSGKGGNRTRFHKYVHFYLLHYCSGDPKDHDHEVNEARWVDIDQAIKMLTFESERRVAERAREMIQSAIDN